jgi:hypothetical protein
VTASTHIAMNVVKLAGDISEIAHHHLLGETSEVEPVRSLQILAALTAVSQDRRHAVEEANLLSR